MTVTFMNPRFVAAAMVRAMIGQPLSLVQQARRSRRRGRWKACGES